MSFFLCLSFSNMFIPLSQKLAKQRELQYLRLSQRIDREKKMFVISQKIQTRKDLQVSAFIYISPKPLQHGHFSTD